MFAGFDTTTLLAIGIAIVVGAYFLAAAMDGVMGPDGFGTFANMVILVGLYAVDYFGLDLRNTTSQAVACVAGAFGCLATLATLKAVAGRFGY